MFSRPIVRLGFLVLLLSIDTLLIKLYYEKTAQLPFRLPKEIRDEINQLLPTPASTPIRLEDGVTLSDAAWVGSIVYGKLTNTQSVPLISPEIFFTLSGTPDGKPYIASFIATIAAKIDPGKSVYFSQRFQTPAVDGFWWSSEIVRVSSYSGQPVAKPPTGQKISSKPIVPPTTSYKPSATNSEPWGVAKQINDVTWTIKLGQDDRMATPEETLLALNNYRQAHGSAPLTFDDKLASFANSRAAQLDSLKSTDEHKGFKEYVANEDNVKNLGFWSLGENSGYGSKLIGVHLIEWVYASDPDHNSNQLDKRWSHVGIGIKGLAVVFIFGGDKI